MGRISLYLNRIASIQANLCAWSMILLGVSMTFTILIQIFFRFVIYRPVPWSEELARYLMVWMGMLGSVIALRKGRHIGVTFLMDKLRGGKKLAADRLVQSALIGFLAVIGWEGASLTVFNASQLSAAMEIPMSIPYAAIPVGAAMMIIEQLAGMLQDKSESCNRSEAVFDLPEGRGGGL
jgi:TRAP-type C4-dicarboxylate transport system permease small subunit